MTRIDSVRHAADVTKDSVRHAAEVAAPYANTAKDSAVHYGKQAGCVSRQAGVAAKKHYDARLAPHVGQAREQVWAAVPPKAANAVETAARRTLESTKAATEYTVPKVSSAVAATRSVAGPAKDEAVVRGAAALQALRGQVTAADINRLVRRRVRRRRTGRVLRDLAIAGLACGAAVAAWKWWSKQSNPDWLVEPPEATEVGDRASMNGSGTLTVVDPLDDGHTSVNGSAPHVDQAVGPVDAADLDPEVEAKQSDADRREEGDR